MLLYGKVVAIVNRSQCFAHFDFMGVLWWLLSMFRGDRWDCLRKFEPAGVRSTLSKWPSRTQRMVMQMQTTEDLHQSRTTSHQINQQSLMVNPHFSTLFSLAHQREAEAAGRSQLLFYESAHRRERFQVRCQTHRAFWWWFAWRTRRKRWGLCGWLASPYYSRWVSQVFVCCLVLCCVSVTFFSCALRAYVRSLDSNASPD